MTAESIAKALHGHKSGGQWLAKCPAHDDRNPSLSLRDRDGRVLAHCHAGCGQDEVIGALEARGLWESDNSKTYFGDRIERTYDYTDENGCLLYQVVRLHSPRSFRQRYPDPNSRDGWTWKKHPQQVLYRLPEILEAPIAFVVEGEKDVETMREYGFAATTNAGGANTPWLPSYTQALAGREVILVPDRDNPGRQRVLKIARALIGHAAGITVFEPDDAKDITEWFGRGHSELELIAIVENEQVAQ